MRHGIMTRLQRKKPQNPCARGWCKELHLARRVHTWNVGLGKKDWKLRKHNMKTRLCAKLPKITLQPEFFLQVPCLWTCMSVGSNRNPSGLTWVAGKSSIFRGASWKLNTPNTVAQWCGSWLQNGVRCQTKKKPPELVSLEFSYTIHFWRTNLLS